MSQSNQIKPKKEEVIKSFNDTGAEVSLIRKGMIDYCKENTVIKGEIYYCRSSKEPRVNKLYKIKYFDDDLYFGIVYDSLIIQASSRLEAIIIIKDHLNKDIKTFYPSDAFRDDNFLDIVSHYIDTHDEQEIFKSEHIHKIMEKYIEHEFENDTLWLVEYNHPKYLEAEF
jgi:hypothetical protein